MLQIILFSILNVVVFSHLDFIHEAYTLIQSNLKNEQYTNRLQACNMKSAKI